MIPEETPPWANRGEYSRCKNSECQDPGLPRAWPVQGQQGREAGRGARVDVRLEGVCSR